MYGCHTSIHTTLPIHTINTHLTSSATNSGLTNPKLCVVSPSLRLHKPPFFRQSQRTRFSSELFRFRLLQPVFKLPSHRLRAIPFLQRLRNYWSHVVTHAPAEHTQTACALELLGEFPPSLGIVYGCPMWLRPRFGGSVVTYIPAALPRIRCERMIRIKPQHLAVRCKPPSPSQLPEFSGMSGSYCRYSSCRPTSLRPPTS